MKKLTVSINRCAEERARIQKKVRLAKMLLKPFLGKIEFQKVFEAFYGLSLIGMNFGTGDIINNSGEIFVLKYLKGKYSKTKTINIFDVGANIGNYASMVLTIFHNKNVKIFSFEPSKIAFERLKTNIGTNENVILNNFGLGEENKRSPLFSNEEGSGLASLYHRQLDHLGIAINKMEEVEIKKLDDYCNDNNIGHINLLKIDVEGSELGVLYGAKRMLSDNLIDFIQFEFGGCNIDSRTYFRDFFYLLSPKYKIHRIMQNGLYPIGTYGEINEIFITTNYLAEKSK
jgi:FkbM family methyltransferase